jgi:hypothetical protein
MKYKQAWLTGLVGLLLVGCGGGGGGNPVLPHASFSIAGLGVGKSVTLALTHDDSSAVTSVTALETSAVSAALAKGTYTVKVSLHPQRQLCQVVNGRTLSVASTNVSVSVECHTTYLNDTGVTDTSIALSGVDGAFGRDAAVSRGENLKKLGAGRAGFDFTKICADGDPVSATGVCKAQSPAYTNEWACTQDNVTRLMWDKRTFTSSSSPPAGIVGGPSRWCGVPDSAWRKPTVHELISIIDNRFLGANNTLATVDRTYFPNIKAEIYKAGEQDYAGKDWYVDFLNYGTASITSLSTNELYVAELSGSRVNASLNFTVTGDNSGQYVIVDGDRDLIWLFEKNPQPKTWAQALSNTELVNTAAVGGHSDWRLPNKNELDSLVDRTAMSPTVYAGLLNGVNASVYQSAFWTNTKWFETASVNVWRVDFTTGDITLRSETDSARAVYVRNRVTTP